MSAPEAGEVKVEADEKIISDDKAVDDSIEPDKRKEESAKEKEPKEAQPPPPRVHKVDFEKDVVYLFQFSRTPTLPSISPFCLKVETWLRLNGVKYEVCFYILD